MMVLGKYFDSINEKKKNMYTVYSHRPRYTYTIVPYSYLVMGTVGSISMTVINFTLSLVKFFHGICLFEYTKQYKYLYIFLLVSGEKYRTAMYAVDLIFLIRLNCVHNP